MRTSSPAVPQAEALAASGSWSAAVAICCRARGDRRSVHRLRRARGARSGPRRRGSRRQRACGARHSPCDTGGQELVDTVECQLDRQRLRGTHGDLGVVGVHRHLLGLVPSCTGGLRRLRRLPPRPATTIRAGLPQCVQQLLRRLRQSGRQGLALPRRSRGALRCGLGRSRPRGDGGGPVAAPLADVLRQIEQRPLGAGRHLYLDAGRGGNLGAEGGRPFVDQSQQNGELECHWHPESRALRSDNRSCGSPRDLHQARDHRLGANRCTAVSQGRSGFAAHGCEQAVIGEFEWLHAGARGPPVGRLDQAGLEQLESGEHGVDLGAGTEVDPP